MLIHSANQVLTLAGGPQRGSALGNLGIIEDGAVLIRDETIVEIGPAQSCEGRTPMKCRSMPAAAWSCRAWSIRTLM